MQMMGLEEEQLDEKIKGLENKARKSGISYGILRRCMTEVWRLGDPVTVPVLPNTNGHLLASTVLSLVVRLAQPQTKIFGTNTRAIIKRVCEEGLRQAMSGKRETDSQKRKRREKDNFISTQRDRSVSLHSEEIRVVVNSLNPRKALSTNCTLA